MSWLRKVSVGARSRPAGRRPRDENYSTIAEAVTSQSRATRRALAGGRSTGATARGRAEYLVNTFPHSCRHQTARSGSHAIPFISARRALPRPGRASRESHRWSTLPYGRTIGHDSGVTRRWLRSAVDPPTLRSAQSTGRRRRRRRPRRTTRTDEADERTDASDHRSTNCGVEPSVDGARPTRHGITADMPPRCGSAKSMHASCWASFIIQPPPKLDYRRAPNSARPTCRTAAPPDPYAVGMTTGGNVDVSYWSRGSCVRLRDERTRLRVNFGGGGSSARCASTSSARAATRRSSSTTRTETSIASTTRSGPSTPRSTSTTRPAARTTVVGREAHANNANISGTLYLTENSGNQPYSSGSLDRALLDEQDEGRARQERDERERRPSRLARAPSRRNRRARQGSRRPAA